MSEHYIMHYGRKGMKWGQSIFKSEVNDDPLKDRDKETNDQSSSESEVHKVELNNTIQMALDYISDITPENVNPNDLKNLIEIRDSIIYLAKKYSDSLALSENEFVHLLERLESKFDNVNGIYKRMFSLAKTYKSNHKVVSDNEYFNMVHGDIEDTDVANEESEELQHHGVDGQKWGVRNGPPYPLDRQRSKYLGSKAKAKRISKDMDDLSLEELRALVTRMELEEKVYKMSSDEKTAGKAFATQLLEQVGKTVLSVAVPAITTYAFKKIVEGLSGEDTVKEMFPKKK